MTLAAEIRGKALKGPALWSTVAFFAILVSSVVMVIATTIYAVSWVATVSNFGWESYEVATNRPDEYMGWIADAARRWPAVRGNALAPLSQWISLAVVAALLFVVGYSGFRWRTGYSLTTNDWLKQTPERARRLLGEFGYFNDILVDDGGQDVMAARRKILFPSGIVENLTDDKCPSEEEAANIRFFMAHEYAHALTFDNAAHSLFRLVFLFTAVLTSVLLLLLIVPTVMISVPFAGNVLVFLPVCSGIIFVVISCLVASMRNVIISYFKAREYFADTVAYYSVPSGIDPYRFKEEGPTSAWNRSTSKAERDLHRHGLSLNARNMLPALLVLFVSLRSLFIVVTPVGAEWTVLVFDGVYLAAVIALARYLPPPALNSAARPLMPWIAAFIALLALFLSFPGLFGMLVYFNQVPILEAQTGILLAWPILFAIGIAGSFAVGRAWARLFKGIKSTKHYGVSVHPGRWHSLLLVLAVPGRFFSASILVILLTLGTISLNVVVKGAFHWQANSMHLGTSLVVSVFLLALACLVYRNLLFLSLWLGGTEILIITPFLATLVFLMTIVASDPPTARAEDGTLDIAQLLANATPEEISAAGIAASIPILVYFLAKLLEYTVRKIDKAKRDRGWHYG